MKVAVLSLTRDRLAYTQHCFASLAEHAGCQYDHYVLDQGSGDGTPGWLLGEPLAALLLHTENIGINRGMARLVQTAREIDDYDVLVKFDNDCELTQTGTLEVCARLALAGQAILSPRILGLNQPPAPQGEFEIEGERVLDIPQIGGCFMAVPAALYDEFRYDESKLLYDDVDLCWWYRRRGGRCGYVERLTANHYETTTGQEYRYPGYFERKRREMARR